MNRNAPVMLPVRSLKYPTADGPIKPPVWPTELIRPKQAAAADSLKNNVGIDQKTG